jgi:CHAT domain-containing protein/tetratricopeptide (TPR) repeat protein
MRKPSSWVGTAFAFCTIFSGCADVADQPARASALDIEPPSEFSEAESSTSTSLIASATEAHYRGQYDSARIILRSVIREADPQGDPAAKATAMTWLGLGHWRQGELTEAREAAEEALRLKRDANLTHLLFRSYNALGLLAWDEGRLEAAAELFQEALRTARLAGEELGAASAAGNMGLVYADLGEFTLAREGFQAMRDAGRRLQEPRREANALTNLGMLDVRIGRPNDALPQLNEALRLQRSTDHKAGEENALGQLGTVFAAMGDLSRAHAYYDSALAIARGQGLAAEEAQDLEILAELYRWSGDYPRALRHYEEAEVINERLGRGYETATNLRAEAEILAEQGDLVSAKGRADRALRIHSEVGEALEVMRDQIVLADLESLLGEEAAVHRINQARDLANRLASPGAMREAALAEARISLRSGDAQAVLTTLDGVRNLLSEADFLTEWEAEYLRARANQSLGRWEAATAAAYQAVEAVERVRRNFTSRSLSVSYASARNGAYDLLVELLLRRGNLEEAFSFADGARGGGLREHLSATRERAGGDLGLESLLEGEGLLRQIDQLITNANDPFYASDPVTVEALARRLADARNAYEDLLLRIAERPPGSAAFFGSTRVDPEAVRGALREGEVLLEYFVTDDRVFIFALDRTGLRVTETEESERQIVNRVRLAREYLGRTPPSGGNLPAVFQRLFEVLIAPALRTGSLADVQRIIVVPHGVLTYLPFAALKDPTTGRYLVEDFSILNLPSAAALPILREGPDGAAGAGIGTTAVFAPFPRDLPASVWEVEAVSAIAGAELVRTGTSATEGAVRQALVDQDVVHLASHGIMNRRNPMFSRIEMERGGNGLSSNDGRLEAHEVLATPIRSRLVFLSGCETGLGTAWSTRFSPGEDYTTLAKTFLFSGAKNVVATLWRLQDRGAGAFAEIFYRELQTKEPLEALAEAQRAMMMHPEFSSPRHWAGYQISGRGY